jgi:hypothetical protein
MEMLPTPNLLEPHNLMVIQVRETQDHRNLQMEEVAGAGAGAVAVVVAVVVVAVVVVEVELQVLVVVAVEVELQVLLQHLQHLYQFKDHCMDH